MDDGQNLPAANLENAVATESSSKSTAKLRKSKSRKSAALPKKPTLAEKTSGAEITEKKAPPPWTFPKNTLEDSIKIARAIEEQNAGNPMKPDMLSKAVGYNSTSDWRFLDLLRSANQYGIVIGSGKISPVSLTEIGQDIVAPSSPSDRPKALQKAFRSVEDFRKVEEFYRGKKLPEDEFLKIPFLGSFPSHAKE